MRIKCGAVSVVLLAIFLVSHPPLGTALLSTDYSAEKAFFSVQFKDEISSYRVTPMFVLPGEKVTVKVKTASAESLFEFAPAQGSWSSASASSWVWTAPKKTGLVPI